MSITIFQRITGNILFMPDILHRLIYINFESRNYEFDKYNSGESLSIFFQNV